MCSENLERLKPSIRAMTLSDITVISRSAFNVISVFTHCILVSPLYTSHWVACFARTARKPIQCVAVNKHHCVANRLSKVVFDTAVQSDLQILTPTIMIKLPFSRAFYISHIQQIFAAILYIEQPKWFSPIILNCAINVVLVADRADLSVGLLYITCKETSVVTWNSFYKGRQADIKFHY